MIGLFPRYRHAVRRAALKLAAELEDESDLGWYSNLREDPPCINDTAITSYLNRSDVRSALFIPTFVQPWDICSDAVGRQYQILYQNMVAQFRKILGKGLKILVYHGDTDMACNFLMGQQFTSKLGLQLKEQKRAWFSNNKQIAGFVTRYKGLDFVTIKGAGHMVPTGKPAASLEMLSNFINNAPYR